MALPTDRDRRADRTRDAILDAAALLFSDHGFTATSLADVGSRAGVSRATPGYFFGSKAQLYQAVLDRAVADVRRAVRSGRDRALASGRSPEEILAGAVGEYFDYLHARPAFVRLIERASLDGSDFPGDLQPALAAGQEALAAIAVEVGLEAEPGSAAAQLLLSIISLCWFPVVHARTVATAVGVPLDSPAALSERRQHVIALILHGLRGFAAEAAHAHTGRN